MTSPTIEALRNADPGSLRVTIDGQTWVREQVWLPIETNPKDGEPFWGLVGEDAIRMLWHSGFREFVSPRRQMTMADGWTIDGERTKNHSPVSHRPEYWMPMLPLPTPPEAI